MIRFRHRDATVGLLPGQSWAAPSEGPTYHDTSSQELRQIGEEVRAGEPWAECVGRHYRVTNPWLYRIVTDPSRDLFFRQHPPPPNSLVLDIGSGWGQIARPLAQANRVVALEPTPERLAFIQAAARQDGLGDRIVYVQADFMDVEFATKFDLVCCIGVLEWVPKFRPGDPWELQRDFLRRIRALLAPGGKLVVGIENRLGLKYLLGAPDDHIGLPDIAVLDRALATQRYRAATGHELRSFTHSLAEYRNLLTEAGFGTVAPYAAFPDYKVPEFIALADETLEHALANGAPLPDEHDGSKGDRLSAEIQQSLRSHYCSMAGAGISRFFAPSFFLVATHPAQTSTSSRL